MRMRRALVASLFVAFVVLSVLGDSGAARPSVMTGIVTAWQAGEWIAVANDHTDPGGVRIALRETVYEGDPGAVKPGVRVTVWYRSVGERWPVADKLLVVMDSTIQ